MKIDCPWKNEENVQKRTSDSSSVTPNQSKTSTVKPQWKISKFHELGAQGEFLKVHEICKNFNLPSLCSF